MIRSGYLGFLIFVGMMMIFFVLPDPEGLQKPFRIGLGLFFVAMYFSLLLKGDISKKTLLPLILGSVFLGIMFYRGTIQTSFINAYLCLFGLLCMPTLFFDLDLLRQSNLKYIMLLAGLSILIQFLFYSSEDGRPSLSYQMNLSGAYLFLFFITSDILKNKFGKFLVILLSIFTLSRLLIFSLLLVYLIRYGKKYFRFILEKFSAATIVICSYLFISFFSIWYTSNMKSNVAYETGISRVFNLNDGSNEMRFFANTLVLGTIFANPIDGKVLLGFGPVENFISNTKNAEIMPHAELFDSVIEFGILSVLFFAFFSLPLFNKVCSFDNIEYLLPVIFHTLILWVRYLLVPSFEMLFILFLLYLTKERIQPAKVT